MSGIICKEYKIFITSFPRLAGTMRTRELQTTHDQVLIAPSKRFAQTCTRQGALPSKQRNASSQIQQHAAERPLRRVSFSGPVQPPSFIFGQSTGLGRLFRPSNSAADSSTRCRDVETTGLGECRYPAVWHPAIRTRPVLPGLGLSRDSKHNHPLCRICHLAAGEQRR